MGWFDWIREFAADVSLAIETGFRGLIDLPAAIRPYIFPRPAAPEHIEEIIEELYQTDRFIREAIPGEATRLARGVLTREKLTNVWRIREWVAQDAAQVPASSHYQISVRGVVVGPDGRMASVDVAFPTGEAYTYDEFVRRAASSLEDDFVAGYDVGRSEIIRQYTITMETYIQYFTPI